jgi:lipopolysaccharide/colanic/teichoic acid biosynthesis glycosyltransferase
MRARELESDPVLPAANGWQSGLTDTESKLGQHQAQTIHTSREFSRTLSLAPRLNLAERCATAAVIAVLSLPVACVLLAVRVLSGQPPLVAHRRVGLYGKPLWVLKIRTMWDRHAKTTCSTGWIEYLRETEVPVIKRGRDPRVTSSFASMCRKLSIDELPQLVHIVSGEMRLAGPRPLTQHELDLYYGEAAAEMLSVPPGITGLWQIMGRNDLTYSQRRRLDLFFVRRRSSRLYWLVLLRTPACVLRGRGVA